MALGRSPRVRIISYLEECLAVEHDTGLPFDEVSSGTAWQPPSIGLNLVEGIWEPESTRRLSYPADGNDACRQVEDDSFWFVHRNACILEVMRSYPPQGVVYDIGGGNGFVSAAMQQAGYDVVLVEPGSGARNGLARGVNRVIHSALEDAGFAMGSLGAAGAFDVVEHIDQDDDFIAKIRQLLRPGGRFYCTVPAIRLLWSEEDARAGHFRRYTQDMLVGLLRRNGMEPEFLTPIFTWLVAPIFICRTLPYHFGLKRGVSDRATMKADHSLPSLGKAIVDRWHAWEIQRLARRDPLPFGTSLLCVAKRP